MPTSIGQFATITTNGATVTFGMASGEASSSSVPTVTTAMEVVINGDVFVLPTEGAEELPLPDSDTIKLFPNSVVIGGQTFSVLPGAQATSLSATGGDLTIEAKPAPIAKSSGNGSALSDLVSVVDGLIAPARIIASEPSDVVAQATKWATGEFSAKADQAFADSISNLIQSMAQRMFGTHFFLIDLQY